MIPFNKFFFIFHLSRKLAKVTVKRTLAIDFCTVLNFDVIDFQRQILCYSIYFRLAYQKLVRRTLGSASLTS